jgi:biotin carboxyl carrier protein
MKYEVIVEGRRFEVEVEEVEPNVFSVVVGGKRVKISVSELGSLERIETVGVVKPTTEVEEKVETAKKVEGEGTPISVAMAGTITKILKKEGDEVREGEDILILEAMKMENSISSPKSGKISKILVKAGDKVAAGDVVAFVV